MAKETIVCYCFFLLYDQLYVGDFQDLVGGRNYRRLEEEAWQVEEAISRKNSSFLLEIVQIGEGGVEHIANYSDPLFLPLNNGKVTSSGSKMKGGGGPFYSSNVQTNTLFLVLATIAV